MSAEKETEPNSQAKKRKLIKGKQKGDWPLRRTNSHPSDGSLLYSTEGKSGPLKGGG